MKYDSQLALSGSMASGKQRTAHSTCLVHRVNTQSEIEPLRDFWAKHNLHPDAEIDFYSMFISDRDVPSTPFVLVASSENQISALLIGRLEDDIIPLKIGYFTVGKIRTRRLIFLQDGFLGDQSAEMARVLVSHVISCLKDGVADMATFSNLCLESEVRVAAKRLPSMLMRDYSSSIIERWRTELPKDINDFLKRRSKKHRYWFRRICRVFEEEHCGQIKYQVYEKPSDVNEFCSAAEEIACHTYQRGLGVGFRDTPKIRRRVELHAKKEWLKGYIIWIGNEPVAFWCGRLYKNVMYVDWTGFKPAYRKYELGTVAFLKMVEDLCKHEVLAIDYGTGGAIYKERFGDSNRPEENVSFYAPTLKGVSIGILCALEKRFNQSIKAVFKKMKVLDAIKKRWRRSLTAKATESEE